MYDKILVPLDGSQTAEQVFPYVAELAMAFSSEVIVIGVCEPEESDQGQACSLYVMQQSEHLKKMAGGASLRTMVLHGKADGKITEYAAEENVDIIFMTSHGKSGIMPWSLGSTVNRVLTKTGHPVFVVRVSKKPTTLTGGLFQKILVPLDETETSTTVLPYVAEIAQKLQSEVTLLHAIEPGRHVHSIGGLSYVPFKDIDMEKAKSKAREYLGEKGARLIEAGISTKFEVMFGESANQITKLAEESNCNLIAMSSHRHSAIDAWAHGSVTYKILQASNKNVLLVPASETTG